MRFVMLFAGIMLACTPPRTDKVSKADSTSTTTSTSVSVPPSVVTAIREQFPNSEPYGIAVDSLLGRLERLGIKSEDILWGQSTCVDDITNTKNKPAKRRIKGPFTFGGLGGLPFTGVTGVSAFAHHVPEEGTALLFVGPHIGYNAESGWGKILRHGQQHPSTCCGALVAALDKLTKGGITLAALEDQDYQEETIEQLALKHRDEILSQKEPLVKFTQIVFHEAEREMTVYASKVKERHFKYAVVVVGVIINTDYEYDDYLWIDHVAIKDIAADKWLTQGL